MKKTITKSIAIALFAFIGWSNANAQWSSNPAMNNAICQATNDQKSPQLVSDGSGGAIITWQDKRGGINYDIYVQRINASGIVQWTVDGVAICTAADDQSEPSLVSDGSGGVIVTWNDRRPGTYFDIYAQRINGSGIVQWTADGVAICTAAKSQTTPQLISDGSGGAIITWDDDRGATLDIYAQRINGSGIVQWIANGAAICTATDVQTSAQLISDGNGGAIITFTWKNYPNTIADIYVQRINASGIVQWTANGVAICTAVGMQQFPQLISDGNGGAIITWEDPQIHTQRINASGIVQWTTNGVAINTAVNTQPSPQLVSDGSGGAIITWGDMRSGFFDIYVQRINASGIVQWTGNGVTICTAANSQNQPKIISDSCTSIITWRDLRGGTTLDIYASKIYCNGSLSNLAGVSAIHKDQSIVVYPNPSSGKFQVSIAQSATEVIQLKVTDILGKEVHSEKIPSGGDNYLLDLSYLQNGIYLLRGNDSSVQKIIIQK
ncbi:MAG: T9SS type A sorting domain-containing protein [Bacteroidota bacterium]|mgnify:CR=1 FL=1